MRLPFASLLIAAVLPAHAAYKCTAPGGGVTFQDGPCAGNGGQEINVRAAPVDTAGARARLDRLKFDAEVAAAIREHRPLVGMTQAQLEDAMGAPAKANVDHVAGKVSVQNIYPRPEATWYVYTENARVVGVQMREGTGRSAAAAPRRVCPSALDIANARTSASSISLTWAQREEKMREIAAMEACR